MGAARRPRSREDDGAEEIELLSKREREEREAEFVASRASIDSAASSEASFALGIIDRVSGRVLSPEKSGRAGLRGKAREGEEGQYRDEERWEEGDEYYEGEERDEERDAYAGGRVVSGGRSPDRKTRLVCWLLMLLCAGSWGITFMVFWFSAGDGDYDTSGSGSVASGSSSGSGDGDADIAEVVNPPGMGQEGEKITMDQWLDGSWRADMRGMSWISGANGEDGLYLQKEKSASEYLRVEDIRSRQGADTAQEPIVLMKSQSFTVEGEQVSASNAWPSPDLKTVLVISEQEGNWRHSYTGRYWLFDVESEKAQPLDPHQPGGRVQLATWSPASDAVVFTRDNNIFLRNLSSVAVKNITEDGGADVFYGVPDWVYEEEVFHGNSATWWSLDAKYIAFLRTDETEVPEFPVQYFLTRPSGDAPPEGEENYPDVVRIKYPKAGAPNPIVEMRFYDVESGEMFSVDIPDDLADDDRLIVEVVWADQSKVLVRETNRESDVLKMMLIDAHSRTGEVVRSENVSELDGGWVEVPQTLRFVPADPDNGRSSDGYIDTVVKDGYDHLAYFKSLDGGDPVFLTSGNWQVVDSPTAVDLEKGVVYFVATKEASWERHVYSVRLDGSDLQPTTNTSDPGYYDMSFSTGAGYGLISYQGPGVPWQKVISTPSNNQDSYVEVLEQNKNLKHKARKHAMPLMAYSHVTVDNFSLPVVEYRPPTFDPTKKYPVLFHLYGGPESQTVDKRFKVDFQTYVASTLEYIVVIVDGRGTGFNGRASQCIVRDNLGYYEARDQIETAKIWGKKSYVDESRMAIWGWSYGGFMTLKTLEQDGGRTFQYGMAVAPVTDWKLYDSIYTERYMHTPQNNPDGYDESAISNTTALAETTRFLIMHGMSDDNVHLQNSLVLLNKLVHAGVDNYDVHVFPDSAHSITYDNAYRMVHSKLSDWLVNAFNGEWDKIRDPAPSPSPVRRAVKKVSTFWRS